MDDEWREVGKKIKENMKGKDAIVGREKKMKNSKNMDNIMTFGDNEERNLEKRKKKRKGDMFAGYEDDEVKEEKKKKRDHMLSIDDKDSNLEKKKKKKKEERENDYVSYMLKRRVGKEKGMRDDMKAYNKDDKVTKEKEKRKENKEERPYDVEAGMESTIIHLTNKPVNQELDGDDIEKGKFSRDDMDLMGDRDVPKIKKRSVAADSSKHATPKNHSNKAKPSGDLKVLHSCNALSNTKENESGLVQGKRFSKEEDEMIRKAVSEYVEAKHLGEEGIVMVLQCRQYPELKGCWNVIGARLPWRPRMSVYWRAHILFERGESKWTPEDVEALKKVHDKHTSKTHQKYESNWRKIADELGKHRVHVFNAWHRFKLENMKKGKWSQDEYQTLFELVNADLQMRVFEDKKSRHGMLRDNISWQAISDALGTRTQLSCCSKWYHQLSSPLVAEGKWADVDDYRLLIVLIELDASCEDEVDWDNLLEHRSADLCRNRWQQMVRHLGEHGNKSFSEQVEVLSRRYCPDLVNVRETIDAKEFAD